MSDEPRKNESKQKGVPHQCVPHEGHPPRDMDEAIRRGDGQSSIARFPEDLKDGKV